MALSWEVILLRERGSRAEPGEEGEGKYWCERGSSWDVLDRKGVRIPCKYLSTCVPASSGESQGGATYFRECRFPQPSTHDNLSSPQLEHHHPSPFPAISTPTGTTIVTPSEVSVSHRPAQPATPPTPSQHRKQNIKDPRTQCNRKQNENSKDARQCPSMSSSPNSNSSAAKERDLEDSDR